MEKLTDMRDSLCGNRLFLSVDQIHRSEGEKVFFQMNGIAISITGCWEKTLGQEQRKKMGAEKCK